MKTIDSLSNELLQKAYDVLCKKFNLKRIYVSFRDKCITGRYKCRPYLKALTDNNRYVCFMTEKSTYAYVRSLQNDFRIVSKHEIMNLLLELLGSTSIYLYDMLSGNKKLFLHQNTCLEEILITADCLSY